MKRISNATFVFLTFASISAPAHAAGIGSSLLNCIPGLSRVGQTAGTAAAPPGLKALPQEAQWRANFTIPAEDGTFVATNAKRESAGWAPEFPHPVHKGMKATNLTENGMQVEYKEWLVDTIESQEVVTGRIYMGDGIKTKVLVHSQGWDGHTVKGVTYPRDPILHLEVGNLGSTGELQATVALPISGHIDPPSNVLAILEKAAGKKLSSDEAMFAYAKYLVAQKDPLVLQMIDSSGKVVYKSEFGALDLVTYKDIKVKLNPKEKYTVQFWPKGSGGVGGYSEGRQIHITWDGT